MKATSAPSRSAAESALTGVPNDATAVKPPVGDRRSAGSGGGPSVKAESATTRNSATATIAITLAARDLCPHSDRQASWPSDATGVARAATSAARAAATSVTSAAAPDRKNIATACSGPAPRPSQPSTSAAAAAAIATHRQAGPARPGASAVPRRRASGRARAARAAAQARAEIDTTRLATRAPSSGRAALAMSPNAWCDPAATAVVHARARASSITRAQSGPRHAPATDPTTAAASPTRASSVASRRGGQPIAASTPISRRRAVTSSRNNSHSSTRPAITTNDESARNSGPNGVEPRAAARASAASGMILMPTSAGSSRAASAPRSEPRSVTRSRGTCQAVVAPKRLPASVRAVASDTNAFGVVPYVFQYWSSSSCGGVVRTRDASNGNGGSQSAIESSSLTPSTSGTSVRSTAAPRIAAIPLTRRRTRASSMRP